MIGRSRWHSRSGLLPLLLAVCVILAAGCAAPAVSGVGVSAAVAPGPAYHVWVASEAIDQVALIRFDGTTAELVRRRSVSTNPVEVDGPHGVALSPDGRYLYVTLGHGTPNGWLLKIDTETDRLVNRAMLARFPATVAVTPDGQYAFVSNFNLHGDHVASSISMVHLESMLEMSRTETCIMPHGSRVNPQGTRHYSVCMMDELLIELETGTGGMERVFSLRPGREGPTDRPGHGADGHAEVGRDEVCSPTWVEPSADGARLFVTCNRAREVLEIDIERWEVVRRFATGESPYNIAVTPDGRWMLVTLRNRTDPALEVYDLRTGGQAGRVPVTTTLAHGVVVSPDSRFAFVSVEGVGSEPGKVDIIDLAARRRVASVDVGQQATGIALVPAGN